LLRHGLFQEEVAISPDHAQALQRWKRAHPRFPGVRTCVELLRLPNLRGALSEVIRSELLARAPRILGELVEALEEEPDQRVKHLLLRVVAESQLPQAVPVLARHLINPGGAVCGDCLKALRAIGTEEARQALADGGWS